MKEPAANSLFVETVLSFQTFTGFLTTIDQ